MAKLSAKDLGVDLTPRCKYCGEKLNTLKVENYSQVTFDVDSSNIHVCDANKIIAHEKDMKKFIKETRLKQEDILKLKEVNENQLNKRFNI